MFNLYILFPPIRQNWVKQLTENEPQHNQNASGTAARQLTNHYDSQIISSKMTNVT